MAAVERIPKDILWFNEVDRRDIGLVGSKGINLSEMTREGIPVPFGFIVTTNVYFQFLQSSRIANVINGLLQSLDTNNSQQLQETSTKIQQAILSSPMPSDLAGKIEQAYTKLGRGPVAVRPSATSEDLPEASSVRQQSTYLNITGEKEVVMAVQRRWASLFTDRAILYRVEHNLDHFKAGIAVVVQKMVQSEVSGLMFTSDPMSNDRSLTVIESILGLGGMIVSEDIIPDYYLVNKRTLEIVERQFRHQEWKLVKNVTGQGEKTNIKVRIKSKERSLSKLSNLDIMALAKIGKRLEERYQSPQDVEWAKENCRLYILQTKPLTTIKERCREARLENNGRGELPESINQN